MYSFSIRQFIWEYIGGFFWESFGVQKNQQGSNGRFPYKTLSKNAKKQSRQGGSLEVP